jgi:hypothetical protein
MATHLALSPEMRQVDTLITDLRAGRIVCTRKEA